MTITIQEMTADVTRFSKKWANHRANIVVPYEDILSENLFWLARHHQKLSEIYSEKGEMTYRSYLSKSLTILIQRFCSDYKAELKNFGGWLGDDGTIDYNSNWREYNGMNAMEVEIALKRKEHKVMDAVDTLLTDKQKLVIEKIYFEGVKHKEIAAELGCSVSVIHHHEKRGIKNIVNNMQ